MAVTGTDIARAQQFLEEGKLVAIPTETVYGLAAKATDPQAVAQIFAAKSRPAFDPLIVHLYNLDQLEMYCQEVPEIFYRLYHRFSPGPVTYILHKKDTIPDLVTSGHSTVGIRFPRHPLTQQLLKESQLPLAAPSANPFGYVSPTTAAHVEEQLGAKIDYILDGGPCKVGIESTIIDLSSSTPTVLRLGGLALEDLEKIMGPVKVQLSSSSNPSAPGMLSSHYAPGKRVMLGNIEELISENQKKKLAVLSFTKKYSNPAVHHQMQLSPTADLAEAAANLFVALREFDKLEVDLILAEKFPPTGLGRAINDRLQRAAYRGE